jgi:hypothetical protein
MCHNESHFCDIYLCKTCACYDDRLPGNSRQLLPDLSGKFPSATGLWALRAGVGVILLCDAERCHSNLISMLQRHSKGSLEVSLTTDNVKSRRLKLYNKIIILQLSLSLMKTWHHFRFLILIQCITNVFVHRNKTVRNMEWLCLRHLRSWKTISGRYINN